MEIEYQTGCNLTYYLALKQLCVQTIIRLVKI